MTSKDLQLNNTHTDGYARQDKMIACFPNNQSWG